MARSYYGPALAFGTLADVLGSGVRGLAEGQEDARRRELEQVRMAQIQQAMGFAAQRFPKEMEETDVRIGAGRFGLTAAEARERRAGELFPLQKEQLERGLERPTIEDVGEGFFRITEPGKLPRYERPATPERHREADAALKQVKPGDLWSLMQWYRKYPEVSGGLEKMLPSMERYFSHQADQELRARRYAAQEREINARIEKMKRVDTSKMPPAVKVRLQEIDTRLRIAQSRVAAMRDVSRQPDYDPATGTSWSRELAAEEVQRIIQEKEALIEAWIAQTAAGGAGVVPKPPPRPGTFESVLDKIISGGPGQYPPATIFGGTAPK